MTAITITPAAATQLRHLLQTAPDHPAALSVGVRNRGCSGMSYDMRFLSAAEVAAFDALPPLQRPERVEADGACVYVDSAAALYLIGTVMDWVDDGIAAQFKFTNPNEKGRCGCGESFTV